MTHWITGVKRLGNMDLKEDKTGLVLSFSEEYHVTADGIVEMWEVMRDAIPTEETRQFLPVNGLPLPSKTVAINGICICKTLGGRREEGNPLKWTFTSTWSSKVEEGSTSDFGGDPTQNPETVVAPRETLFETVQQFAVKDLTGQAYANGAGQLFNPPLQTDIELSRWDFAQFEPIYSGVVDHYADTVAGMAGHTSAVLTSADVHNGVLYPPGTYKSTGGGWSFVGTTESTVSYFNGAVNLYQFRDYAPFTLLLKVRKSVSGVYYGVRRRLTEYTIIHDPRNHWDKPLNAGPFFIAAQLDANGEVVDGQYVPYPYIYYTKDVEDKDTDLVVDEAGMLGFNDGPGGGNFPVFNNHEDAGATEDPSRVLFRPPFVLKDQGYPVGGYRIVTAANGKKTIRALKPDRDNSGFHMEYVNHAPLDFGKFLRVR